MNNKQEIESNFRLTKKSLHLKFNKCNKLENMMDELNNLYV